MLTPGVQVNVGLMALSVVTALASCVATMYIAGQSRQLTGWDRRFALLIGALQLGAGVWTVHFMGALAFDRTQTHGVDYANLRMNIWPAVVAAIAALGLMAREHPAGWKAAISGLLIGSGMGLMEYGELPTASWGNPGSYAYVLVPFALTSVLSGLALWLQLGSSLQPGVRPTIGRTVRSGAVLASGLAGMHLMDALTTDWRVDALSLDNSGNDIALLVWAPVVVMVVVIVLALGFTALLKYRRLAASLQWAQAIIADSSDAIVSKTTAGIITSWNAGAEKVFGYTAREAIGQPMLIAFPEGGEQEEESLIRRILSGETIRHYEAIRKKKDGTLFPVSVNLSPILDSKGNIVGISKIARDVSARLAHENLKRTADKAMMEAGARAELLRSVSHELRTPIHWILGNLDAMGDTPHDETTSARLQGIRDAARSLQALVHTILDSVNAEHGGLELCIEVQDVTTVLDSLRRGYEPLAKEKSLAWSVHYPANEPLQCRCDLVRLEQALRLLLDNAFKFTEQGSVQLRVVLQREEWVLEVEDTGIGIAAEELAHVFQPLKQVDAAMNRRYAGLGLGCTLSKQLVEKWAGAFPSRVKPAREHGCAWCCRSRSKIPRQRPAVRRARVTRRCTGMFWWWTTLRSIAKSCKPCWQASTR